MSLEFEILGAPGEDNAVFLRVDSGQTVDHLLFDCGEGCLNRLGLAEIQSIDHLFFSHLHMDHVCGFDTFFRHNYQRQTKPNQLWGPPGTRAAMHHKFRGYLWNLHTEMDARWSVTDISPAKLETTHYELKEAFATAYPGEIYPHDGPLLVTNNYMVSGITLDHGTPVIGYVVREQARKNIDVGKLATYGFRPGPWMQQLKGADADAVADADEKVESVAATIDIAGQAYDLAALRADLLVETPGDSVAYLTDFGLDEPTLERLSPFLAGCQTIICEAQYRHADLALAEKNHHLTSQLAAQIASRVAAHQLVLFHLSRRYRSTEWWAMLAEAQQCFPNTVLPRHWRF